MKKVDASNKNVRIAAEPDSPQNKLRGELYKEAFRRIDRGLEDKRYFEVIALADSIIGDRVQALTQDIIFGEPEEYAGMSVGGSIEVLFRETKTRNITLPPEIRKLMVQVHSVWCQKRNMASHAFVVVTPKTISHGIEDRLVNLNEAAVEGASLARSITDEIEKFRRKRNQS